MFSNIVLYLIKKQMSKTQAKRFSLKFVPYLFIAVTILTTSDLIVELGHERIQI